MNTSTENSCSLADIEACINRPEFFTVDAEGNAVEYTSHGELDCIDYYYCYKCGEDWTPDGYGKAYQVWPEVLEHVGREIVAS